MGMIRKTLTSLEDFIGQVLSISSAALSGSGTLGSAIVVYNEDGTLKVNENNEIEIVGSFPDSLCLGDRLMTIDLFQRFREN
jgi:hypothetical protein